MSFAIAGGAAAVLVLYKLFVIDGYSMPLSAVHWWVALLSLEGAQGAAAVLVVKVVGLAIPGLDAPVIWVLAGCSAPQFVRKIQFGGVVGDGVTIDVQDLFDRIGLPLRERIDSASAQKQSAKDRRLVDKLAAGAVSADTLAESLLLVIRRRMELQTLTSEATYIRDTAGSDDPEREKLLILVERARNLHILWTVRQVARTHAHKPSGLGKLIPPPLRRNTG